MATNNVETDDPGPSYVERPTTAQHRGTLEDFYNNGLTHYGSKENKQKVEAIVQLTGLKRLQVKRWIDNRNRKGKPRSAPKKAVNLFGRGKSGYGGFKSKYMKGKTGPSTLADANRAWSRLTAEEKKTYSEKAKQHVRPTVADLSEDSKQATVRKLIQEMEGVAVAASRPTVLKSAFSWSPHLRRGLPPSLDQPAGVAAFSRLAASRGGSALATWPKSRRRQSVDQFFGVRWSWRRSHTSGSQGSYAGIFGVQVALLCACEGPSLCTIEDREH
ncbi:hypothetical protein Bbelb_025300 [Branchiostoma belcheri]|nr:hypothetical protein Bbelb_025300 [Branchiostoma belcheri]